MPTTRIIPTIQSSDPLPSFDVYYLADPRNSNGGLYFPDRTGPYHSLLGDKHPAEQLKFVLDIPSDLACYSEGLALLKSYQRGLGAPEKNIRDTEEARKEYRDWEDRFPGEILFRLYEPLSITARKVLRVSEIDFEKSHCKRVVVYKLIDMDGEDKALLSPALREKHLRILAFWGLLVRAAHRIKCSRG